MASCKINGISNLIRDFGKLVDDLDETIDDALAKASETLVNNTKSNIRAAANRADPKGKKYSTGALAASVSATKPKENQWGHFVAVRPTGQDSKDVRNGEKWGYLEYGVAGAQDAHPFIEKTVSQSEDACVKIVQEVFENHIPDSLKI